MCLVKLMSDLFRITHPVLLALSIWPSLVSAQQLSVAQIIENSVKANRRDFEAATSYDCKERDRTPKGSKTSLVTMIDGTPYYRLLAMNGKPLSPAQDAEEKKKQEQAVAARKSESPEQRRKRLEKFEKDRRRDAEMMAQLTKAFNFTLAGRQKLRGFDVWALKATPRSDYRPPNMETEVLAGMRGELWIDQKTFQWVKVTAQVVRPVSIGGLLAQVQPGTQFELEKTPVSDGIWLPSHFSMKSDARILHLFNHGSQEDETYFDYRKSGSQ